MLTIFLLIAGIFSAKPIQAVSFSNITENYKNTYIVRYGTEIKVQKQIDETITIDKPNIAIVENDTIKIMGVGHFTVTIRANNKEEKMNFFAWNTYLEKGKYWTYQDVNRSKKAEIVYSKVYFAVSETENGKTLKIEDYFFKTGKYSGNLKGKYITSYYNKTTKKSTTSYYQYAFESNLKSNSQVVETAIEKITLNYNQYQLKIGETVKLEVNIEPNTVTDSTIRWTSNNSRIAKVENGTVTAIKEGTTKITAQSKNGKKAECLITVEVGPKIVGVKELKLDKEEVNMLEGETLQLTATINPKNATNKTLTWSSSNTELATVDQNGLVSSVKPGTVNIQVNTSNGKAAICKVTIYKKEETVSTKPIYSYPKTGKVLQNYSDDSIYVSVEKIDKYYVAKIWVKDPSKQIKKKEAGWGKDLKTVSSMLNATGGAIIGCNGSGFYKSGSWTPRESAIKKTSWNKTTEGYLVISGGTVRREIKGKSCNALLGILPNGSLKYYENNPYTDVKNDGVQDTFTFGPLLIKDGKKYRQIVGSPRQSYTGSAAKRTTIGQIDENNFVIITTASTAKLTQLTDFGLSLHCQLLYNLDGGGSTTLWFRKGGSGKGTQVKSSTRGVGDALYFTTL